MSFFDKKKLLEQINKNREAALKEMKKKAQENPNMDPALRAAIEKLK